MVADIVTEQDGEDPRKEGSGEFVLLDQPEQDRVALQGAEGATVADHGLDDADEEGLPRMHRCAGALGLVERRLERLELHFEDGEHDRVLRSELVVDRGLRDADGVGDHLERGPADAVVGKELEGRVDGVPLGRAVAGGSLPETPGRVGSHRATQGTETIV